jgi:hypothetical protein
LRDQKRLVINLSSQRLSRGHIILCSGRAASASRAAISFCDQVEQPALSRGHSIS